MITRLFKAITFLTVVVMFAALALVYLIEVEAEHGRTAIILVGRGAVYLVSVATFVYFIYLVNHGWSVYRKAHHVAGAASRA